MSNYLNPYITDEELADEGCIRIIEDTRYYGLVDLVSDAYLTVQHYHYSDIVCCLYTDNEGTRRVINGAPEWVVPQAQAIWAKAGGRDDC